MPETGDPQKNGQDSRNCVNLNLEKFCFALETYAKNEGISPQDALKRIANATVTAHHTLVNWHNAAKKQTPIRVTSKNAILVSKTLGVAHDELFFSPNEGSVVDFEPKSSIHRLRSIEGLWQIEGSDTSIEPHFAFTQQPRSVRGQIDIQ